jgi:hypothetical protein
MRILAIAVGVALLLLLGIFHEQWDERVSRQLPPNKYTGHRHGCTCKLCVFCADDHTVWVANKQE